MTMSNVTTAVCKTIQSIGISPRKEHQIENVIVRQLESSGPEFVLNRISNLRDWRKMHMKGDTSYHPEWHKFKLHKGCCTPADAFGSQIWGLSDKAFFAVTGSVQKAIELTTPTEKQLNKWLDGVRCENNSADRQMIGSYTDKVLDTIESDLEKSWKGRPWFNVSDISGTNIPGSGKYMSVAYSKRDFVKDPYSLLAAYGFSVNTAPLFVWQFLEDIEAPQRLADGIDDPDELIDSLKSLIDSKLSSNRLLDEAIEGTAFYAETADTSGRKVIDRRLGFAHSVGNIGFLQQEGGKLRTVANPNRLVQYINIPLGESLASLQDRITGVFVRDQDAGMDWAMEKLRAGVSLSSFDMSAATDRLDYSKWIHERFKPVFESPERWPLLCRSLELFEDTSQAPWAIPGHIADLLGIQGCEISWSVGQPLGLRPSFPTLTLMNSDCARIAVRQVDGKYSPGHFACVGDDLIIETRYAQAYMDAVAAFNGKINNDKTMVSDRYAEFCSHIVTRSNRYPIKPRFILEADGSFGNVEKFSTSGLRPKAPKWVRDLHGFTASYHIDGMGKVPYSSTSTPKSLDERLGVNALIVAMHSGPRDDEYVTLQTLYTRAMEIESRKGVLKAKELSSSYADSAYPSFGGSKAAPNVNTSYDKVNVEDYHVLGGVSTDGATSVALPVKTEWDYREQRYIKPVTNTSSLRKLRKKIEDIETVIDNGLVTSSFTSDGTTTSVVIDTSVPTPQALIVHSHGSSESHIESVEDIVLDQPLVRAHSSRYDRLREMLTEMDNDDRSEDDSFDYR